MESDLSFPITLPQLRTAFCATLLTQPMKSPRRLKGKLFSDCEKATASKKVHFSRPLETLFK